MLGGFDPNSDKLFFQRRRGRALLAAVALYAAALAYGLTRERSDAIVEVQLEPELTDFAVEEEEPPKEEEPPPPPPPDAKVQVTSKPKPKPKLKPPPAKPQDVAPETTKEKTYEVGPGGTSPGGTGTGSDKPKAPPKPKVEPPKPKVEPPKPKKPEAAPIDPTKPIDRPENATAAKPDPGNAAPKYPESLRDEGITGEIVLKLHIHRDGTVRGAKVLRKKSTAATDEAREEAEKLFLAAAIAAVKTWKFTPSTVAGEPISVWQQATIPFSLTGG